MSYVPVGADNFVADLLQRKEFYSLKNNDTDFRGKPDEYATKVLKIHSHQLFVRNFMSPNTPNTRIHLSHGTGTGKTTAAIVGAWAYQELYAKMYNSAASRLHATRRTIIELDRATPSIIVLGFGGTKTAFTRDLLKHPEFGFITVAEREEMAEKARAAKSGLQSDIKAYKDFKIHIRRRLTSKSRGGFFRFYGYDEFVNRLFTSDSVKLIELETMVEQQRREGLDTSLEDVIRDHIKQGIIRVNKAMIASFANSIMIGDEIHNTYNTNMKNNRGVAIQIALDMVPTLRFISLSATPINNSPTEVIDLFNYLLPPTQRLSKRDFFSSNRELRPGKLEELGRLSVGRISFLQDSNIRYFPQRIMMGEPLLLPRAIESFAAGNQLPYLKFMHCKMSPLHQRTLVNYLRAAQTEGRESIPTDGYTIYDMVFPNPEYETPLDGIGLFRSMDIKNNISGAPQSWKDAVGITVKKQGGISLFSGDFLGRANVGNYFAKGAQLLDLLHEIIGRAAGDPNKCEKIMIYHDRVKTSGVLLIQELLKTNGIIDEITEPTDSTLCCVCGKPLGDHNGADKHEYKPVRFVIAHSEIDRATMDRSLANYNAPSNAHGLEYMILVGSKIIKESYEVKDTQNQILLSMPANIPTMLQIIGRVDRKYSHLNLPEDQRRVRIYIMITVVDPALEHDDPASPEMLRYADKIADYMIIQKIEREINRLAIDADINRDIIMSPSLRSRYFPPGATGSVAGLGNLYYEPAYTIPQYAPEQLNLSTFNAYKHFEDEIKTIKVIIKRLFLQMPVWHYGDLWATVRNPPFGLEINPALFGEGNFAIALSYFVSESTKIAGVRSANEHLTENVLISHLFNPNDRYIYKNGERYKIRQVAEYYVLCPVVSYFNTQVDQKEMSARDKEREIIKTIGLRPESVIVDVDSFIRWEGISSSRRVNVAEFTKNSRSLRNYEEYKKRYTTAISAGANVLEFLAYNVQFQLKYVEDAIVAKLGSGADDVQLKTLELFESLGVLVGASEAKKYKDVAKLFKDGVQSDGRAIIGYTTANRVRLYDEGQSAWLETSKISMNRHATYKENDIIVGYYEQVGDDMKFKLRHPIHHIKAETKKISQERNKTRSERSGATTKQLVIDTRLAERGIVCTTKNKGDLLTILSSLGYPVAKMQAADMRVRTLCQHIMEALVAAEVRERARDSRYKYIYGWWDEAVSIKEQI